MNERARPIYPAIAQGHKHPEAFCLMSYATEDRSLIERIWNSRDGVSPFIVASVDGREMRHINWQWDVFRPDYKPAPGERIFVSRSREKADESAREYVAKYWDDPQYPMRAMFATQDLAIKCFADERYGDGNAPALVTVQPDGTWEA